MLLDIQKIKKTNFKTEALSGLTVALALVPEAVAFAFIAKVSPLAGLYAAFIVCLITSVFGGRPGMISGATGALAVVMTALVVEHGVQYLFATVVLMGIIQVLIGLFKLGKFIRLVPAPVVYGFVNGLAIVIFMAQLPQFKNIDPISGALVWMQGPELYLMVGLALLTMLVIAFLPKFTKAFPAPLAGIALTSAIAIGLGLDTKTVGDMASIKGGLPIFSVPDVPFSWETFKIIFPYSLILAGIGLIESLLTLTLVDDLTETRGDGNRECKAQGLANIVTGFFGGMGGCAMIGQSMINVTSGARSRLSGVCAGLFLLTFILFGSSIIEMVPLAALAGVMFMVSIGTFEWATFRVMSKVPKSDAFIILGVTGLTLAFDLAIAVLAGVVLAAIVFAWDNAQRINFHEEEGDNGEKVYKIEGDLFFASTGNFQELFTPETDPKEIIVDFGHSRVVDQSAIEALNQVSERYAKADKVVKLKNLGDDCKNLLIKAKGLSVHNVE